MLIKKIEDTKYLPNDNDQYRRGMIVRQKDDSGERLVLTVVAGGQTPFFHLRNKVCSDPKEALAHLIAIDRDYRTSEVYGDFTPEVVCHLREHGYHVNLISFPLFQDIKHLKIWRVTDVEELEFQEHVKIGSVFKCGEELAFQQSGLDEVHAVLVSTGPINTIKELMSVLKFISTRVKKANVYIECGNGFSKLMTEKGFVHHVY